MLEEVATDASGGRFSSTVVDSDVDVTFDPPWSQDLMSDAARLQLGLM